MTTVARPAIHHVALTVTDLDASVGWYEQVFGLTAQMDAPHQGGVGKILADRSGQLIIALHRHDTAGGALFGRPGRAWTTWASWCRPAPTWKPGSSTCKNTA